MEFILKMSITFRILLISVTFPGLEINILIIYFLVKIYFYLYLVIYVKMARK